MDYPKLLIKISYIFWWILLASTYIILTAWFKYSSGLVGTVMFVMIFLPGTIVSTFITVLGHTLWENKHSFKIFLALFNFILVVVVGIISGINYFDINNWQFNYIQSSSEQVLYSEFGPVKYSYKSINQGSWAARDYLIVSYKGNSEKLPIKFPPTDGFDNIDMINFDVPAVLYPTEKNGVFLLETYDLLKNSYFEVDIDKKTVSYIKSIEIGGGSCGHPMESWREKCVFLKSELFLNSLGNDYVSFGLSNTLSEDEKVSQHKTIHLALSGHNYFLPFESKDKLPVLNKDDLISWGEILDINNNLVIIRTFNRAGDHKIIIDIEKKNLETIY